MKAFKQLRTASVNGLLLAGLIGLLATYLAVVGDLPSRVYTATQQEYLAYNYGRSVSQLPPTWNIVQPDGRVASVILPGQKSRVRATLTARYEEQEGVSVTVYDLDFQGEYHLAHSGPVSTSVELFFPFPDNLETLHEVRFVADGQEPHGVSYTTRGISWQAELGPDEAHRIGISYLADGATSFTYGLHRGQRADVDIAVNVVGLTGSQVPRASLPVTASEVNGDGETFAWDYTGLIADRDVQLRLPTRLSFAQRVAQLQDDFNTLAWMAPLLVGLFLASLSGVLHLGGVRLELPSYLLAGCGMALFYPLLTFLSGMVDLTLAAPLALGLVSGLLLAFVSLVAGWRGTWWRVGLLLVIFLGFLSLGTLTPWQGLLLSGGGLLLVGTFMLLYARRPAAPEPQPADDVLEPEVAPSSKEEPIPEPAHFHCPCCARALADDYRFCPGCGYETHRLRRCAGCGHEYVTAAESEPVHCIRCGQSLKGAASFVK